MAAMMRGLRIAAAVFVVLIAFWTPRVYTRVADKSVLWTETVLCPVWKQDTTKFTALQVPVGVVMVPREELSNFRSMAASQRMEPKPLGLKVPIVERGYVCTGWNWSILLGYLLFSLALGVTLAWIPWAMICAPASWLVHTILGSLPSGTTRRMPSGGEPRDPGSAA